jgi:pyruvate,orthophosphate dikinase
MFFGGDRIDAVREMILAEDESGRRRALAKLLPMQRNDFIGIFRVMKERPVTIRTLDPPLHEFLPHTEREIELLSQKIGIPVERINQRMSQLKEFNPMLGNRGCRLGIVFPEITEMQARAIFEAACIVKKEGIDLRPEVMIPLVGYVNELKEEEQIVRRVAEEVFAEHGVRVNYLVGTMIELPRAAVTADEIASVAEFFSFGTNDLTQTTLGLSRDDSGTFLPQYLDHGIFDQDPFQTLDRGGVGALMEIAVKKGRSTRRGLKIGICGEHGGDPKSIEFCSQLDFDYVSCSPFRVPIARLAAAQAALQQNNPDSNRKHRPAT